ncbi:hypothetical protein OAD74_08995 [Alphaproteobacteria bacterium]|nr:hypothetical protein [Alphaproteobacteria bacterium]
MSSLTKVQYFTDEGISAFKELLIKQKPLDPTTKSVFPNHLVNDPKFVKEHSSGKSIDPLKKFKTSYDLGVYLCGILGEKDREKDVGLWSWLSNVYIDHILYTKTGLVGELTRYIPAEALGVSMVYGKKHRHLLRGPFDVIYRMRKGKIDPEFARALLQKAPGEIDQFYEDCASRNTIMRNQFLQKTATSLYWDSKNNTKVKGYGNKENKENPSSTSGQGGIRRFAPLIIPRVQENFDLEIMKPSDFVDAWGDELKNSKFYKVPKGSKAP